MKYAWKGAKDMKLIAKIIALPFILALTVLVAVLGFLCSLSGWLASIAASLLGLLGVLALLMGYGAGVGVPALVMAFLLSPFGLPAFAEWIIGLLDGLNYSLKAFVMG